MRLRYPLSQPVRLTALPKGEPRALPRQCDKLQFVCLMSKPICLFFENGGNILGFRRGGLPWKQTASYFGPVYCHCRRRPWYSLLHCIVTNILPSFGRIVNRKTLVSETRSRPGLSAKSYKVHRWRTGVFCAKRGNPGGIFYVFCHFRNERKYGMLFVGRVYPFIAFPFGAKANRRPPKITDFRFFRSAYTYHKEL